MILWSSGLCWRSRRRSSPLLWLDAQEECAAAASEAHAEQGSFGAAGTLLRGVPAALRMPISTPWRRSTFCISCRSRKGRDHCARFFLHALLAGLVGGRPILPCELVRVPCVSCAGRPLPDRPQKWRRRAEAGGL